MSLEIDRELYPCIGICSATALGDKFCAGCGRTEEQIRDWNTYPDYQKKSIIKIINNRNEIHKTTS